MSKFWSNKTIEIEPYVPGEQPKDKKYIKLNTNENPYPPTKNIFNSLKEEYISDLKLYSDPDVNVLREELAKYFNIDKDQIFFGNGSDEVLAFSFMTFFNKGDKIYYPDITYSFYTVYSKLFDLDEKIIKLDDNFEINIEQYYNLDGGLVICNPNAPTTVALSRIDIENIVKNNPNNIVIVDEAYVDFGAESVVDLINIYDNLLVIQTFSKSRSLAGQRLGYAVGNKNLIDGINRIKFSFNSYTIDRLSILFGIESIKDNEYFLESTKKIINTREKTKEKLTQLGFNVLNSKTNFLFLEHKKLSGENIYLSLKEKGILVRYFKKPRIDNFIRVTIGTEEEMSKFLFELEKIIVEKV